MATIALSGKEYGDKQTRRDYTLVPVNMTSVILSVIIKRRNDFILGTAAVPFQNTSL